MNDEVRKLIEEHLPIAESVANRFATLTRESAGFYYGEAYLALCHAAKIYDSTRTKYPFSVFARQRIQWALYKCRKRETRNQVQLDDDGWETIEPSIEMPLPIWIATIVNRSLRDLLDKRERMMIDLYYFKGLSFREITEKTGYTNPRYTLLKALRKLQGITDVDESSPE